MTKHTMEIGWKIRPTKETQIKIVNLRYEDYKEQLKDLKANKSKYDYKTYRYMYVRLYTAIADQKRIYKRLEEN